jgi:quinolinate synthase
MEIIFVPDQHLARHVSQKTHRKLIIWPGYCHVHVIITEDDIKKAKAQFPDAVVMVHPECTEPVKALADQIFSTGQMLSFAEKSPAETFIIGTETGIIHTLKKQNPNKKFIPANEKAVCPNMKKITLEKILFSLEDMKFKVTVPKKTAQKAKKSLDRMVQILPQKK